MGREASETSVSPEQNNSNPSPVPGPSTDTAADGLAALKASATSELIGSTVDEPETTTSPSTPVAGVLWDQPASVQARWVSDQTSSAKGT